MAGAFVQGKFAFIDASSQSSLAVVFDSNVAAASVIAVFIKYGTATSVFSSITDSQSNTYNAVDSTTGGVDGANTVKTFYAKNVAAGATTVTLNFTGANGVFPRIMVLEYSGLDTSASVLNAHEIASQSGVTTGADGVSSAGSAVTTVDGCTIVGFTVQYQTPVGATVAGTNFTIRTDGSTATNNFDHVNSEDRIQSTAGSVHATFTCGGGVGNDYTTAMMAFQVTQSGGLTAIGGSGSSGGGIGTSAVGSAG